MTNGITKHIFQNVHDFNNDGEKDAIVAYYKNQEFVAAGILAYDAPGDTSEQTAEKIKNIRITLPQDKVISIQGDFNQDGNAIDDEIVIDFKNQMYITDKDGKRIPYLMVKNITESKEQDITSMAEKAQYLGAQEVTEYLTTDETLEGAGIIQKGEEIKAIEVKYQGEE